MTSIKKTIIFLHAHRLLSERATACLFWLLPLRNA